MSKDGATRLFSFINIKEKCRLMNIKSLQPRYNTKTHFKQGFYTPLFPAKYCGKLPIIYRSSWEYKVCKFLDECATVLRWGSECIKVSYFSMIDERYHEYFPDFYFEYKTNDGVRKIIAEVKPKKDLTSPEKPKRMTEKAVEKYQYQAKVYIRNMEKAKACRNYCDLHGMEYKFITEDSKLSF